MNDIAAICVFHCISICTSCSIRFSPPYKYIAFTYHSVESCTFSFWSHRECMNSFKLTVTSIHNKQCDSMSQCIAINSSSFPSNASHIGNSFCIESLIISFDSISRLSHIRSDTLVQNRHSTNDRSQDRVCHRNRSLEWIYNISIYRIQS